MMKLYMRSIVAVALVVVLGALAMAQPPATIAKAQPAKKDDVKKVDSKDPLKKDEPKKVDTVVKTFELKSANPNEIQQFLTKHLAAAAAKQGRAPFLVAVDARNKTVFVRGATADVETAGKVIAQLDGSSTDGPLTVIVIQHTNFEETMRILNSLELGSGVHACPASHVLVIPHSANNVDQIKTIVEKLEASNKPKAVTATPPKGKN